MSQNARQYNAPERKFSYTRYDALGRVVEVGEKTDPATGTGLRFKQIFGAMVSGTYNPTVISETKLISWIENNDGERREVTKSYYDEPLITQVPVTFDPHTQRKRITHVTYEELYDDNDQTYDHASHFVYDIHGNVKTLVQDNRKMAVEFASLANQRFKRMDYTYDLVSGNVHRMSVTSVDTSGTLQPADQWHHAYRYDADNRIVEVFTSRHTPLLNGGWSNAMLENELTENPDWHKDAHYVYYDHGPLARVELGKDQLQGLDYVYNLQGWLKGVNATSLTNTLDPGKDGVTTGANPVNGNFAKDVFAFSLHYHQGDYTPIGATAPAATINSGSHAAANSSDLYNGNIRFMQTTLTNPTTREAMPMLNAYRYDQLNRLAQSRSYENGFSANEWNPTSYANNYFNAFTFDAMGNILTQKRHKRDGTQIEDMTYRYKYDVNNKLLRNRLYHVNDAIAAHVDDTDIDDMGTFVSNPLLIETANNYSYDEEGRLIKDTQEGIERIIWRVDGKVKSIERPSDSGKKNVSFEYDAFGRRIAKHVFDDDWNLEKSTYYILDAQGNQLSMYEHTVDSNQVNFTLAERNIYGASRLGRTNLAVNMYSSTQEAPINEVLGYKNYELSNHLGNVLTVINDIKIPLSDDNQTVSEYDAGIVSISDYSPFGVQLDGRTLSAEGYRYGFNSMESDNEVKGNGNSYTTHFRQYDPRVGRWLSLDPEHKKLPWSSPYVGIGNNPIMFIDKIGDFPIIPLIIIAADAVVTYIVVSKGVGNALQETTGNRDVRQIGYGLDHPYNAVKVDEAATNAGNFSTNISKAIGKPSNEDGTPRNAIRHTLWNAFMAKEIGSESAREAANSHETHTNIDWHKREFGEKELYKADHTADMLNNIIGRRIGEANKNLSNQEIAKKVLEYYKTNGLWTVTQNDNGSYTLKKTLLSKEEYEKGIAEINKKGEDGLNKK